MTDWKVADNSPPSAPVYCPRGFRYAPATTFMNGDPYGGPYTQNTSYAVPNC
jgi:hypothetical protein